jgi:hypothetical protein
VCESSGELRIDGSVIRSLDFVTEPFKHISLDDSTTTSLEECLQLAAEPGPQLSTLRYLMTTFRKDAPINKTYASHPSAIFEVLAQEPSNFKDRRAASFSKWYRIIAFDPGTCSIALLEAVMDHPGALAFAIKTCNELAGKRTLFFSRDGHLGCGPAIMAQGDKITLLSGIIAPMILLEQPGWLGR